jgi:hypothetical protein
MDVGSVWQRHSATDEGECGEAPAQEAVRVEPAAAETTQLPERRLDTRREASAERAFNLPDQANQSGSAVSGSCAYLILAQLAVVSIATIFARALPSNTAMAWLGLSVLITICRNPVVSLTQQGGAALRVAGAIFAVILPAGCYASPALHPPISGAARA